MATNSVLIPDSDITYTIDACESDISIRGNVLASGDDAADRLAEDAVLADLMAGNSWAWCDVTVTAEVTIHGRTFRASDCLGACSYRSESDFCEPGDYYDDMRREAKRQLIREIARNLVV